MGRVGLVQGTTCSKERVSSCSCFLRKMNSGGWIFSFWKNEAWRKQSQLWGLDIVSIWSFQTQVFLYKADTYLILIVACNVYASRLDSSSKCRSHLSRISLKLCRRSFYSDCWKNTNVIQRWRLVLEWFWHQGWIINRQNHTQQFDQEHIKNWFRIFSWLPSQRLSAGHRRVHWIIGRCYLRPWGLHIHSRGWWEGKWGQVTIEIGEKKHEWWVSDEMNHKICSHSSLALNAFFLKKREVAVIQVHPIMNWTGPPQPFQGWRLLWLLRLIDSDRSQPGKSLPTSPVALGFW